MRRLVVLGVAFIAVAACNGKKSSQTSTTQKVGKNGGTVKVGESLTLEIPAGALAGDQNITASVSTDAVTGYELDTAHYKFTPEGLTFLIPVTVKLQRTATHEGQAVFWSKLGEAGYDTLTTTVGEAGGKSYLQASNTHFSDVFGGRAATGGTTGSTTGTTGSTCEQTQCGADCVDTQTSTAHCGECGHACGSGQACHAGACVTGVSISVDTGLVATEGDTFSVAFVARRTASGWTALTALNASDAERVREYGFDTAEATYEIVVGCTDGQTDGADSDVDGKSDDRSVWYFKKTTSTTHLDVACVPVKPEDPATRTVTASLTGGDASEPVNVASTVDSSSDGFDVEGATTISVDGPTTAFDLLITQDPVDGPPKFFVSRNLPAGTDEATPAIALTLAAAQFADITLATDADDAVSVGYVYTTFFTPKGQFSNVLDGVEGDGPFAAGADPTYNLAFVPQALMVDGDGHIVTAGVSAGDVSWSFSATLPGAAQNLTIVVPKARTYDASFGVSGDVAYPTLTALDASGAKAIDFRANAGSEAFTVAWQSNIDLAASSAATGDVGVLDLSSLAGFDEAFRFPASLEASLNIELLFEEPASATHGLIKTKQYWSGIVSAM